MTVSSHKSNPHTLQVIVLTTRPLEHKYNEFTYDQLCTYALTNNFRKQCTEMYSPILNTANKGAKLQRAAATLYSDRVVP